MNKTKQLWLLTSVVVVAVLAAGYFLAVSPKKKEVAALDAKAQVQRTDNAKIQIEIDRLIDQRRTLPAKQARLAEIAKNIPVTPALPTLVRNLTKVSKQTGMVLQTLAPSEPVFAEADSAGAANPSAAAGKLAIMSVKVTLWGTYSEVQEFLTEVEDFQRTMLVTGATLDFQKPTAEPPMFGQRGDLKIVIDARVYMRTSAAAVKAAPKPAATPTASTTSE